MKKKEVKTLEDLQNIFQQNSNNDFFKKFAKKGGNK